MREYIELYIFFTLSEGTSVSKIALLNIRLNENNILWLTGRYKPFDSYSCHITFILNVCETFNFITPLHCSQPPYAYFAYYLNIKYLKKTLNFGAYQVQTCRYFKNVKIILYIFQIFPKSATV